MAAAPSTRSILEAIGGATHVYDLSRPYTVGMPQSPNHPPYWRSLPRRHGDGIRADGSSAANDIVVLGTHVGTHMDALAHVSQDGRLYGGLDAAAEQVGGSFRRGGIDDVSPIVGRGLLLDVPAALGEDACPAGYEVTPEDLEDALGVHRLEPRAGDTLLIRTGWAQRWDAGPAAYVGHESGVPGPGEAAAEWLAAHGPRAVGADTIAFEHLPPGQGHALLPAHRVLLVEHGVNIVETLDLEQLALDGHGEFLLVLAPLRFVGATGAPVRPLAITGAAG